ncbi:GTP-binding protein [Shewanella maritima]|uniref:GTP-binding protein n=1 Tax=Shewanella maritima TaxID=2520507 RepID=A0A411PEA5_9GAMM|nr:CobW family GTP-binding protein [Shewanella maritima]QBF81828.1 GTP-binding protein [Shewanella maritima]
MRIAKTIKTNVITGFLGVGKTTLIQQLLANRPEGETWAVLVNEFGQVGIDAELLACKKTGSSHIINSQNGSAQTGSSQTKAQQANTNQGQVAIKQVPGGCLCCAAGLPAQVAINQLIQQAKPDRILIEPTGLGHPKEILQTLQNEFFKPIISLGNVITLVDARKVADERYTSHEIFIDQAKVADCILVSKDSLYQADEAAQLSQWLDSIGCGATQQLLSSDLYRVDAENVVSTDGQFASHLVNDVQLQSGFEQIYDLLNQPSAFAKRVPQVKPKLLQVPSHQDISLFKPSNAVAPTELAEFDWQGEIFHRFSQQQGEFASIGWVFSPEVSFGFERVMSWVERLKQADVLRFKAVVITYDGILGVNYADGALSLSEIDDALDSRIELISDKPLDDKELEQSLLTCVGGH